MEEKMENCKSMLNLMAAKIPAATNQAPLTGDKLNYTLIGVLVVTALLVLVLVVTKKSDDDDDE